MEKSKPKVVEKSKRVGKKVEVVDELTDEEREAVTIVFHQYETGLREGTILVKVGRVYWALKPERFLLSTNFLIKSRIWHVIN